ncbi:MAG: PaaI family thioesterase [Syntrophales bacterium]
MEKVFEAIKRKVEREPYAQKLGLRLVRIERGYSLVRMTFDRGIENVFGMAHGGAIYSLIDEAFETASNSHGTVSVALGVNVNYVESPSPGDILYAEAKEVSRSSRISHYDIEVRNERKTLIAICRAIAYRKKDRLPFLEE